VCQKPYPKSGKRGIIRSKRAKRCSNDGCRSFGTSGSSAAKNREGHGLWKEEYTKLTAERKALNQRDLALKEEVKEADKIRKSVYSILRQEQREQPPHRKQDMER
jgi:hypothetical protein